MHVEKINVSINFGHFVHELASLAFYFSAWEASWLCSRAQEQRYWDHNNCNWNQLTRYLCQSQCCFT